MTSTERFLSPGAHTPTATPAQPAPTAAGPKPKKPPLSPGKRRLFVFWLPGAALAIVVVGTLVQLFEEHPEQSTADFVNGAIGIAALGLASLVYGLLRSR